MQTCTPVSLLHPYVTVRLGHTSLRVQEGHEDAALGTQTSIVTMALFHSISVILLSQPEMWKLDTDRSSNTDQKYNVSQCWMNIAQSSNTNC